MKFFVAFLLIALAGSAIAQTQTTLVLDDFQQLTNAVVFVPGSGFTPGMSSLETNANSDNGIIGNFRDVSIEVTSANDGETFQSKTDEGVWLNALPNIGTCDVSIRYDGNANSGSLTLGGLGSQDLTVNGGNSLKVDLVSDVGATYNVYFHDNRGNTCSGTFSDAEDGNDNSTPTTLPFASGFSGNCDFSDIGAIELEGDGNANVDSRMLLFEIIGPIPTSASGTPPPSSTRSAAAASPSRSRTNTPQAFCHCECPVWTCELIFDQDDDENDAYYFDDDDNNNSNSGNDDDDDNNNSGNDDDDDDNNNSGNDDDDNNNSGSGSGNSSDAAKITVTAALVVVLAALL